ncbi:hypothetical protein BC629DRAFT_1175785 [Irpex lacteus]|nr:hypothetical protein BC629DRAFT_1175785 [Irpex lacteus]
MPALWQQPAPSLRVRNSAPREHPGHLSDVRSRPPASKAASQAEYCTIYDALQNSGPQSHDPFHGWKTSFGQYRYPHRDEIKLIGACSGPFYRTLNASDTCKVCSTVTIDILWSRLEFLHMAAVTEKPSNGSADIRLDMEY